MMWSSRFSLPVKGSGVLGAFCALFVMACSDLRVTSDYSPANFERYSRYVWHSSLSAGSAGVDELTHGQVVHLVDEQLKKQGYRLAGVEQADFLVNYHITAEDRVDVKTYEVYSGYGDGFVWHRETGFTNDLYRSDKELSIEEYRKGTLMIDIVSAKTNKLVWRGVAEKKLEDALSPEQRERIITQAIKRLLVQFPPASDK